MANFNELRKMDLGDAMKAIFRKKGTPAPEGAVEAVDDAETTDLATVGDTNYRRQLPGVNILPTATIQRRQNRQLKQKLIIVGSAIAVVGVGSYAGSVALNIAHTAALEQIQAQNTALTKKVNLLTPYKNYESNVETARTSAGTALKSDIDVARMLRDLNSVASANGIEYTQISMAAATGGTNASTGAAAGGSSTGCFNPDPFNAPSNIGCLTLSGTGGSQGNVTAFFNQFNNRSGFLNGFVSTLTTAGGKATFNGTVAFDANLYSKKYESYSTPLAQLTQQNNTNATGAALATALKQQYPTVLGSISNADAASLSTQTCNSLSKSQTQPQLYQQLVSSAAKTQVSSTDTANIVRTVAQTSCSAQVSKLTFLTGSSASSAPTTSSSTAGTN